jgi:hypothetical protein
MVMGINSLNAKRFNSDYDGDSLGCYVVHSEQGKSDARKYMTPKSNIHHEHNLEMVDTLEHESIQAAYMLTLKGWKNFDPNQSNKITISSFEELETSVKKLLHEPNLPIHFFNEELEVDIILPYACMLLNKSFKIEVPIYTEEKLLNKKNLLNLLKVLYDFSDHDSYHDNLHNFNNFLLECSTVIDYCNTSFDLTHFALQDDNIINFKKTLIHEPYTGFHQNQILFDSHVRTLISKDTDNILTNVFNSGARIKNVQLLKAASNNGIPTDINGKAFKENIQNSLLDGLTEKEFFMTGDSARLALAQRQDSIPKGGELQRKLYFITGFLKLNNESDCGSNRFIDIEVTDKHHLTSLYGRWYKIKDDDTLKFIRLNDTSLIGQTIKLRTPLYCNSIGYKICDRCFGIRKPDSVNLGAAIGAYIAESIIQSVLRTHHFSGAFITSIKSEFIDIINSLQFQSPNIIKGSVENIEKYKQFLLANYYNENDFTLTRKGKDTYIIDIINLPHNDDSVKKLQIITSYIDKNRKEDELLSPEEIYNFLKNEIIMPNDILSIYVELLISILFYDEDGIMIRYSNKNIYQQIALKNVVAHIDPKMSFFYGFNDGKISDCYDSDHTLFDLDHMYQDLTNIYY